MNHFDCHSVLTDVDNMVFAVNTPHAESQLIITTQDLAQSLNNKLQVDMIIMDFSKAFDTVPHNSLLSKLNRLDMAFVTKLTIGFLTFQNIVNKELLLVENTPHGHKSFQVYLKGQYSARYFFSLILIVRVRVRVKQVY